MRVEKNDFAGIVASSPAELSESLLQPEDVGHAVARQQVVNRAVGGEKG